MQGVTTGIQPKLDHEIVILWLINFFGAAQHSGSDGGIGTWLD
jgi:hypothetical protein